MKDITYPDNKKFRLTEKEFNEAMVAWSKGANYFCERIESLLPPMFRYAETPNNERGETIYIDPLEQYLTRYVKHGDKFSIFQDDGRHVDANWISEESKKRLVTEEEYYNNEKKYVDEYNAIAKGGKRL